MIRISELRMIQNLSQKDFGLLFKVSQNTVSQWERGHRGMDPEMIVKIAEHFGISTDYLLGRKVDQPDSMVYAEGTDGFLFLNVQDLTMDQRAELVRFVAFLRAQTPRST